MIKPKYFSRETAPLRFLKILKILLKISIALQVIVLLIFNVLPIISLFREYGFWALISLAVNIGLFILIALASEKLDNWKWAGIQLYYLYFSLVCVRSAINQISQQGMQWSIVIGYFLAWLTWMIPMYIYFEKRRALFEPPIAAIPSNTYVRQESQLKQFIVDESTGEVISEPPISNPGPIQEPEPIVLTYHSDFIPSGPPQSVPEKPQEDLPLPQQQGSKKTKIIGLVLSLVCIASLAGNAVQGYLFVRQQHNSETVQSELQEELSKQKKLVDDLKKVRSTLLKEISDMQDDSYMQNDLIDMIAPEAFAMDTYIGFIYDGSSYCHNYNCAQFPFEDCDEFTAHNVEYCEWLGYPKHASCWDQ